MPKINDLKLSGFIPPESWDKFEDLCLKIWRNEWECPEAKKNGRKGQPQCGVDVYGIPKDKEAYCGIQCKNYEDTLTETQILEEIGKAKKFEPKISKYIIATTTKRDSALQKVERDINLNHKKAGLFSFEIYFWPDILDLLEEHPDRNKLLRDYFLIESQIADDPEAIKEIIRQGYASELEYVEKLINRNKPRESLDYLNYRKDKIWSNCSSDIKYQILRFLGKSKLLLNQDSEAADCFIEALQYNPDDEKAICNSALGYLLLGNNKKAEELSNIALDKNENLEQAHNIKIQMMDCSTSVEDVAKSVPTHLLERPGIINVIAAHCAKNKDYAHSTEWLRRAKEKAKNEYTYGLSGSLGANILLSIVGEKFVPSRLQLDEKETESLREVIALITEEIDHISEQEVLAQNFQWVSNRALAKQLLGDIKGAIEDINLAIKLAPDNEELRYQKSMLFYENGEIEESIASFKNFTETKHRPEAFIILAGILTERGMWDEAIGILNEFLSLEISDEHTTVANRLLVQVYLAQQNIMKAKEISDQSLEKERSISNLIISSKVAWKLDLKDEASQLGMEAKEKAMQKSSFDDTAILADVFYGRGEYESASELYEKIANPKINNSLTRRLVETYFRAGKLDKALDIASDLFKKNKEEFLADLLIMIYQEIGDLANARKTAEEFLKEKNCPPIKIKLGLIHYRSGDIDSLKKLLEDDVDPEGLSLHSRLVLAFLYSLVQDTEKALNLAYETRRLFYNESDSHLKYVGTFINLKSTNTKAFDRKIVDKDTAVLVEDETKKQDWYIIEDREQSNNANKHLNLAHPFAKKLLGGKVGDTLVIEDAISNHKFKIINIQSKFVRAFQESMSEFQKMFPGTPGISCFNILKEGDKPDFGDMFKYVEKISKKHSEIIDFYKEGKITLGTISVLTGDSPDKVWGNLMHTSGAGIKCCEGTIDERSATLQILEMKPTLVIDILSLLTLYGLNCQDAVVGCFGKLGIAQSTIDELNNIVESRRGIESNGFMTVGKVDEQFVKQEIDARTIKANEKYLTELLEWVKNNCVIFPIKASLSLGRDKRENFYEILGTSFTDTILIATEPGVVLYSDDSLLRSFAKNELGVNGIWTQPVLLHCLGEKKINLQEYFKAVNKLFDSNYHYISLSGESILTQLKEDKWLITEETKKQILSLSGSFSDENSSISTVVDLILRIFQQPFFPSNFKEIVGLLMDSVIKDRDKKVVIAKLQNEIERRFFFLPIQKKEVLKLIKDCQR